ncbi:hypothetical protein ACFLYS_00925 [Chloroflexota bacterium]
MVNWQVTTTTIHCDAVDDNATVLVYADGTIKCTGHARYTDPDRETEKLLKKKGKALKRVLECQGLQCRWVTGYKDKLFAEDSGK